MIRDYIAKIKTFPHSKLILSVLLATLFLVIVVSSVWPRSVAFLYGSSTCVSRTTILPGLNQASSTDYEVAFSDEVKLGSFALWANQVCVTPLSEPKPGDAIVGTSLFGWRLFDQQLVIGVGSAPVAQAISFDKPAPATQPLVVTLSSKDEVYDYHLAANNKTTSCAPHDKGVSCHLPALSLSQGKTYPVVLSRSFNDAPSVAVIEDELTIVTQVTVKKSSVKDGSVVYAKPKAFDITFNKPIKSLDATLTHKKSNKTVPLESTIKGGVATLSMSSQLEREQAYILTIKRVEAVDGGLLDKEKRINFNVSGGPRVVGKSFGQTGAPLSGTLTLTLDQEVDGKRRISDFVSVSGVNASVAIQGKQIVISYSGAAKCADVSVTLKKGLKSKHDVVQSNDWRSTTRTTCHTVQTIGYSKHGRPINAYFFGSGSSSVLFTGAIHGNEVSSSLILQDFIQYLEQNARSIPAHRQIVIVPTVNPDGIAQGSRNNAGNVNLNRNFDTNDWKADIKDTDGELKNGGGKAPMSEPETKAIAALSSRLRPRLVLSYHAVGSVTIGNGVGDSARLAGLYARSVGYSNGTGNSSEIFDYEISGTYDDWLAQRVGVASIVVELGSYGYRNFEHHRSAMWAMVQ